MKKNIFIIPDFARLLRKQAKSARRVGRRNLKEIFECLPRYPINLLAYFRAGYLRRKMASIANFGIICILSFVISGCTCGQLTEDQKKDLFNADPDFEKILQQKDQLDEHLAQARSEFMSEKNIYDSQITALRKEFEAKRAHFYAECEKIKSQLNPQREEIDAEINIVKNELANKEKNYQAIKKMLNQARLVIEGKAADFKDKEKIEWQNRFASLTEDIAHASQEVASVKEKLYILKLKRKALIQ